MNPKSMEAILQGMVEEEEFYWMSLERGPIRPVDMHTVHLFNTLKMI